MERIRAETQVLFKINNILEQEQHKLGGDEIKKLWVIFGYPKEIQEVADQQ